MFKPFEVTYSKTCLKWPLKIDKTDIQRTNGCLMKVESAWKNINQRNFFIAIQLYKRVNEYLSDYQRL